MDQNKNMVEMGPLHPVNHLIDPVEPHALEMAFGQLFTVGGENAQDLSRRQLIGNEAALEQGGAEHREVYRCGNLLLKHSKEAAACGDGGDALGLQLPGGADKGFQ